MESEQLKQNLKTNSENKSGEPVGNSSPKKKSLSPKENKSSHHTLPVVEEMETRRSKRLIARKQSDLNSRTKDLIKVPSSKPHDSTSEVNNRKRKTETSPVKRNASSSNKKSPKKPKVMEKTDMDDNESLDFNRELVPQLTSPIKVNKLISSPKTSKDRDQIDSLSIPNALGLVSSLSTSLSEKSKKETLINPLAQIVTSLNPTKSKLFVFFNQEPFNNEEA